MQDAAILSDLIPHPGGLGPLASGKIVQTFSLGKSAGLSTDLWFLRLRGLATSRYNNRLGSTFSGRSAPLLLFWRETGPLLFGQNRHRIFG